MANMYYSCRSFAITCLFYQSETKIGSGYHVSQRCALAFGRASKTPLSSTRKRKANAIITPLKSIRHPNRKINICTQGKQKLVQISIQLKIPAVFETTHAAMSRQDLIKMRPVSVVMQGSYAGARVLGESPIMPAVTFRSP